MYVTKDDITFEKIMKQSRLLEIKVQLSDLRGIIKAGTGDLSSKFLDGQVSVDADANVTRALDLTLFDPQNKVSLDPTSPTDTGIYISDMLKVDYIIENPLGRISVPVFNGPIDDVERDEVFIKVKALGKESLWLGNSWAVRTYKKGQRKTDVIKRILKDEMGETSYTVPSLSARLPNDVKLDRSKSPWAVAKAIARGMGYVLYFDAAGKAVMKKPTGNSKITFDLDRVTDLPKVSYDLTKVINLVYVKGKKPKKGKKQPMYVAVPHAAHPLSGPSLGKPGAPRYLWTIVEDESLRTTAECKRVAQSLLAQGLLVGVDVQFGGPPMPRLAEYDTVTLDAGGVYLKFSMRKFTVPLVAGQNASYGTLRRSKPSAGKTARSRAVARR